MCQTGKMLKDASGLKSYKESSEVSCITPLLMDSKQQFVKYLPNCGKKATWGSKHQNWLQATNGLTKYLSFENAWLSGLLLNLSWP